MILLIPLVCLVELTLVSNILSAHHIRSEAADHGATSLGFSSHRHARYARRNQDTAFHSSTRVPSRAPQHHVNWSPETSSYTPRPVQYTEEHGRTEQYSTMASYSLPSRPKLPTVGSILGGIGGHTSFLDHNARSFLDAHNKVRQVYSAQLLVWNPRLVAAAKVITDTCNFKHTVNNPYGENIAAGQTSPNEVVSQWVDGPEEKSAFDPANAKDSHFTQLVWQDSRQLGCAVTTCRTMRGVSLPQSPILFWACEYDPPGNVDGQYVKNVNAVAGGMPKGSGGGATSESYSISLSLGLGFENH